MDDIDRYKELRDRHCKPDRISAEYRRKQINQNTADHQPSRHRGDKCCLRLYQRLKIIRRENIKRQEQERESIAPEDCRRNLKDFSCRRHEQPDKYIRNKYAQRCPEDTEYCHSTQCVFQCLTYPLPLSGAEVCGDDRLGCLPHTVSAALYKSADIDNNSIDR